MVKRYFLIALLLGISSNTTASIDWSSPSTCNIEDSKNLDEIINQMTNEDPYIFLDKELELRKVNYLPPFVRFISLILTSPNETKLEKESLDLREFLLRKINEKVLGPVEAPVY